jgi:catalase
MSFLSHNDEFEVMWFFNFQTDQGIKNIFQAEADKLAGADPDYSNRDLYESITNGNCVSEVGHIF